LRGDGRDVVVVVGGHRDGDGGYEMNLDDEMEQDKIRSADMEKVNQCNANKMNMDSNESDIELDENDVCVSYTASARFMTDNEVHGPSILETHMKNDTINRVCSNIFGRWQWQHNERLCSTLCRIGVGWDANNVTCSLVHVTPQTMLYLINVMNTNKSFLCTFIYAENKGKDRKELWKDLRLFNHIVGKKAWVLMGDVNINGRVPLHLSSSAGDSNGLKPKVLSLTIGGLGKIVRAYLTQSDFDRSSWKERPFCTNRMVSDRRGTIFLPSGSSNGVSISLVARFGSKVNSIQTLIDADLTNKELRSEEIRVLNEYKSAAEDEEKLLAQKAIVNWLKEEHRNFAYFHKVLKAIQNKNRILAICDEQVEDGLLFSKTVLNEDVVSMIKEVSEKEIKKALFDIDENKAPGQMDILLSEMNTTLIALVPKLNTPFKIVDENQSAFIPERAITDNILITQELLKGYNCANGPKRCALKIDLQMAYDTTTKKAIENFSVVSGLHLNIGKRTLFCGSLDEETKGEIQSILPFNIGKLPVYWGSVFLLPKSVINDIERLFKKFLWNSCESCKGRAKVAWFNVCKPKDQARKESLWVKWVNVIKLKGRSVSDVTIQKDDSWGWKSIFELRDMMGKHMRYKIRNGTTVNIWHDKWCSEESISKTISKKDIYYVVFYDNATERDKRTLGSSVRSVDDLFKVMTDDIRNRLVWECLMIWKGSYRDGWIPVIVDDASYRWLHYSFVRMKSAKVSNVGLYIGKCSLLTRVISTTYMVMPLMDNGLVDVVKHCVGRLLEPLEPAWKLERVKKSLPEKFRNRPESSILTAFMAAIIATLTIGLMAMADIAETRNVVANGGKAYYIIRSGMDENTWLTSTPRLSKDNKIVENVDSVTLVSYA
ncbi:hypothetical protein Tco_0702226, partial [Tanacetum coccineum]